MMHVDVGVEDVEIQEINARLESYGKAMDIAYRNGNTAEYNRLVTEYNEYLESIAEPAQDSQDSQLQLQSSINTIPNVSESSNNQSIKYVGITNILKGLVSNTLKGKYSHTDKIFFISELKDTIARLQDIDATAMQKEKIRRKSKFAAIGSRI